MTDQWITRQQALAAFGEAFEKLPYLEHVATGEVFLHSEFAPVRSPAKKIHLAHIDTKGQKAFAVKPPMNVIFWVSSNRQGNNARQAIIHKGQIVCPEHLEPLRNIVAWWV